MEKQGMSKEEADKLYDSLKDAMERRYGKKGLESLIEKDKSEKIAKARGAAPSRPIAPQATTSAASKSRISAASLPRKSVNIPSKGAGQRTALLAIVGVGVLKLILGVVAASGLVEGGEATATMANFPQTTNFISTQQFSDDEVEILKSLDERRVALEERSKKLDNREDDLERRDREFAARLTQLRDISNQLKIEREKGDKKQGVQLNQLAAVYSSMNPKEAAQLLEQLDITISLSLIERMPEKRMAQILSLMTPERALTLTQMLSKRGSL